MSLDVKFMKLLDKLSNDFFWHIIISTLALALGILFLTPQADGQTAAVSATVIDANGQAYSNGTYTIEYVKPSGLSVGDPVRKDTGAKLTSFDLRKTGNLDSSGGFSEILYRTDYISPTGGSWRFTVCPLANSACLQNLVTTITSSSIDLSSGMSAAAPIVSVNVSADILKLVPRAYQESEINGAIVGSKYWNLTNNVEGTFDGTMWHYGVGNSSTLENHTWEAPGTIGSTTPSSGVFTVLNGIINPVTGAIDIGAQINTACIAGYKKIVLPPGSYNFSTQINCDLSSNVEISGAGGRNPAHQGATTLNFTGTASPIISAASTYSFKLKNIALVATNASWSDVMVDLTGSSGHDTAYAEIEGNAFSASGGGASSVIIKLDKANSSKVAGNSFNNYGIAIQGLASAGSYSNANTIAFNHFSNSTGTGTDSHIKNPYQGWKITENTFEGGATNRINHTLDCTLAGANGDATFQGIDFSGNWVGDGGSTTLPAITCGGHYSGNFLSSSFTIFDISAAATALSVEGNFIYGAGIAYIYNLGSSSIVNIFSNKYANVGTFLTGNPVQGTIETDTGSTLRYGTFQVRGRFDNWNFADSAANMNLIAGLTADQDYNINFQDHTLTTKWQWSRLGANGALRLFDSVNGNSRLFFDPSNGNTYIAALGAGQVIIGGQLGGSNTGNGGGVIKDNAGNVIATWSNAGVFSAMHLASSSGVTQGGGLKHQRFTATTSTAASANATQTTTFSWNNAFADANYTPLCTPGGTITGTPIWQGIVSYNASSVTVQVMAATAAASSFGAVYCTAMHD